LHILLDKNLISRVHAELSQAVEPGSGALNVAKVCCSPLMNAIFMETMRLRTPGSIIRQCQADNVQLGPWVLKKGSLIMANSWLAGRDPMFWNTGHNQPNTQIEHPVDTFWAERFLSYPDDPSSGPIQKTHSGLSSTNTCTRTRKRTAVDDKKATLVTKGLSTHYFPFGGGPSMCPGRIFAKHETLVSIALIMRDFDIELVKPDDARMTGSGMANVPFGSLAFDRQVPIRIRRRRYL
jgi:cytochrome P450